MNLANWKTLLNDPEMRDAIMEVSLRIPIYLSSINPNELEETLPILKEGRFILEVAGHKDKYDLNGLLRKVREASNFF